MSADYTRVYGYDMLVTWDINAPPFFALGPGRRARSRRRTRSRPLGVPNTTGGPYGIPFTGFRSLYLQFNGGHTEYNAVKVGLNKRMSQRYCVAGELHARQRARGRRTTSAWQHSFVPGLTALDGDRSYQWGPSDTDVRHVFAMTGYCEAPLGIRVGRRRCSRARDFRTPA